MKVGIKETLVRSSQYTVSPKGISLAMVFFSLYIISDVLISSTSYPFTGYLTGRINLLSSLPFPDPLLVAAYGLVWLLSLGVTVIGFRAFIHETNLKEALNGMRVRELLGKTFLVASMGLIATLLITVGSLFLLLPGLYLAVSFIFYPAIIATKPAGLHALKESWLMTENNKMRIFFLLVILLLATSLLSLLLAYLDLGITATLAAGFETVLGIAAVSEAFKQLDRGEIK